MQIHMVIKCWTPFDETVSKNIEPFIYKSSADALAAELNAKLTPDEETDRTEYYVETHEVGDAA